MSRTYSLLSVCGWLARSMTRFALTSRAQQILYRHKEEEQYQVANARIASHISLVTNWVSPVRKSIHNPSTCNCLTLITDSSIAPVFFRSPANNLNCRSTFIQYSHIFPFSLLPRVFVSPIHPEFQAWLLLLIIIAPTLLLSSILLLLTP